ncbi:Methyltransferase domain-containing protein [Rhodovastum atsumiense]|nr:class I SAM-dependent methyltransferase [Rhodovastum atsumiense]CAH2603955.1 Methyltransferase domain-containing protein [Rhodovastum atsumiense]
MYAPLPVDDQEPVGAQAKALTGVVLDRLVRALSRTPVPFEIQRPDHAVWSFGEGSATFRVILRNRRALRALTSLDQGRFADAYLAGDIDLEGDMLQPFELRRRLKDVHLLASAWRFLQPLLVGQVRMNRRAIRSHYDVDPAFFLGFLDPQAPCYTQGIYLDPAETLEAATLRKFAYCYEKLELKPGDHILEIGPGWGAWCEYASARGVRCTGITNSRMSADYLRERAKTLGYDWNIILTDLLGHRTHETYDAIIIMGVIEHLPQYDRVAQKFISLLKPGKKIFLDASACTKKYELSSFMVKHIYPGNHSFLVLHDFLAAISRTPLRVVELYKDSYSYFLTFRQWARNLDRNREALVGRFGEYDYRRFRLYLWGGAYEFLSHSLDCYRMVIQQPTPFPEVA